MKIILLTVFLLLILLTLAACSPDQSTPPNLPIALYTNSPGASAATLTISPRKTSTYPPSLPSPSPTLPTVQATLSGAPVLPTAAQFTSLCSPLEGISLEDLSAPDLYKTPFEMPRPGMDDGHHGVDFAFWSRGKYTTMLGLPVYSALSGIVAAILPNRPPYGNAVIIETRLEDLPPDWLDALTLPPPTSNLQPSTSLTCPDYSGDPALKNLAGADRSLYLLYAHFNQPSSLQVGQNVSCGQAIGSVGTSGMSVNPHLHLETRVGPSLAVFSSMAHYTTAASADEMRAYCTWRISSAFQPFDPMRLFSLQP